VLVVTIEEVLPRIQRTAEQRWVNQEVLDRMEELEKAKLVAVDEYQK